MNKRVLVVEDDPGSRRFLKRAFESMGMDYTDSVTTEDALSKCAEVNQDLVLLDYNILNGEIGWKIARILRDNPDVYGKPRIIAISGTVDFESVANIEFSRQYFESFLPKPFDLATLKSLVTELIGS